ncbi:MAG TPA: hypothetical protein VK999_07985 [Methylotenera sp.]|nr:hypothetical protein [Methylotenera sp.]
MHVTLDADALLLKKLDVSPAIYVKLDALVAELENELIKSGTYVNELDDTDSLKKLDVAPPALYKTH